MDNKPKIAVTGATGWLGKNFVDEILHLDHPAAALSFKFFGSTKGYMTNLNGKKIEVSDMYTSEIIEFNPSHLIHLAFKTADYIDSLPQEAYSRVNKKIIVRVEEIIRKTNIKSVLFTTSGVNEDTKTHEKYQAYKDLKELEKDTLLKVCEKKSIKTLQMRIWAVTGNYFEKYNYFAFSQFINMALRNEDIYIKSNNIVNRSYMDAGDIAKIGLTGLLKTEETFINCAINKHINLVNLAHLIKNTLKSKSEILYNLHGNSTEENYYPKNSNLNSFLINNNLSILSLKEQIIKTANYLSHTNEF